MQFLGANQQQMRLSVVRRELSKRSVEHLTGKHGCEASVVLQIIPPLSLASRAPKKWYLGHANFNKRSKL